MNVHDALHMTVHTYPGGAEALAIRMGMSSAILRNKVDPNKACNKPMLDDVDRIMGITADYSVLHALAANHGHVCVKVDEIHQPGDMALLELVTVVLMSSGDVGAEINRALADGRVDPHEIEAVRAAIYRANKAMQEMAARMEGMCERRTT